VSNLHEHTDFHNKKLSSSRFTRRSSVNFSSNGETRPGKWSAVANQDSGSMIPTWPKENGIRYEQSRNFPLTLRKWWHRLRFKTRINVPVCPTASRLTIIKVRIPRGALEWSDRKMEFVESSWMTKALTLLLVPPTSYKRHSWPTVLPIPEHYERGREKQYDDRPWSKMNLYSCTPRVLKRARMTSSSDGI